MTVTSLTGRVANRLRRTSVAARARQLRALLSASGRSDAAGTGLPRRYRWLRIATVGPVGTPIDRLAVRDLLASPDEFAGLRFDLVVVPSASDLIPEIVDVLVECDVRSLPTVLVATEPADLDTPLSAVCRDIASADPDVLALARSQVGTARTHPLPADPNDIKAWLDALTSLL